MGGGGGGGDSKNLRHRCMHTSWLIIIQASSSHHKELGLQREGTFSNRTHGMNTQTNEHAPNWPAHACPISIKCATIYFINSIHCETIQGCYELTMRKKLSFKKYASKRGKKVLSLVGFEPSPYTAVTTTTSGRCFTS